MEIDQIERDEDNWNPTPLKNTAIVSIVFSALYAFIMLLAVLAIGMVKEEFTKSVDLKELNMTLDEFVLLARILIGFFTVLFVLSIVGAIMMMKKSNTGWILFLVANCIIMFFFFFSMVGGDIVSTLTFLLYLTLTIVAGRNRYKETSKFENYSN